MISMTNMIVNRWKRTVTEMIMITKTIRRKNNIDTMKRVIIMARTSGGLKNHQNTETDRQEIEDGEQGNTKILEDIRFLNVLNKLDDELIRKMYIHNY